VVYREYKNDDQFVGLAYRPLIGVNARQAPIEKYMGLSRKKFSAIGIRIVTEYPWDSEPSPLIANHG